MGVYTYVYNYMANQMLSRIGTSLPLLSPAIE